MNLHLINAVTMLREPKARMISAFLYGIHNAGMVVTIHIHAYHDDDDDDDDDDDGLKCVI